MIRKPGTVVAIAILLAPLYACSREAPTSSAPATGAKAAAVGFSAADEFAVPGRAVALVLPEALAPIRRMPELGVFDGGGGYGAAHSSYSRTTDANREFRRGFAEFVVPDFSEGMYGARLVLRESRGWTAYPFPPDVHELSSYTDVDLVVNTGDYDRPTSPIGTFETDGNEPQGTFTFDVSRQVAQSLGSRLGFRVKLQADPTETRYLPMGTVFDGSTTPAGVVIQASTTIPAAIDHLQSMIERMGEGQVIPAATKATLLGLLQRAEDILRDDQPANDRSACRVLAAMIGEVDAAFSQPRSGFAAPQAVYIKESVENLEVGLDCAGRPTRSVGRGRHGGPAGPLARHDR